MFPVHAALITPVSAPEQWREKKKLMSLPQSVTNHAAAVSTGSARLPAGRTEHRFGALRDPGRVGTGP
ncbi:hypothetical protein Shyhy01_19490 [Streptomyces hygroscopicus subsp. hygroscopicus]|nr:hypothetical protein Shyhy01_19490 [Streptomyces hygroscopicus subsp. hygroscopicus]